LAPEHLFGIEVLGDILGKLVASIFSALGVAGRAQGLLGTDVTVSTVVGVERT
jgi:hypothetical protein